MIYSFNRRAFLQATLGGTALLLASPTTLGATQGLRIISPGAVTSKVRVGLLFLGQRDAHWPTPKLDIDSEIRMYRDALTGAAFSDIDFVGDALVSDVSAVDAMVEKLTDVDGLLLIHVSMGIGDVMAAALKLGKPTIVFARPYSGHEWVRFGRLMQQPEGAMLDCILSEDMDALGTAVRPFRAIHHLREAKILNITARDLPTDYCASIADRFGTQIVKRSRDDVLEAYEAVDERAVADEAAQLIGRAANIVEPSEDEISRSCRLALALEHMVAEANATAITVDCYGSMYRQLPAFPCIGFTRLNDMGLAGICESDLASAMTFILMQSLSGRPGFISDPTVDESNNRIILAHCLGSTKMLGPEGDACPFRIRSIMEREEGAVMQVFMPVGPRITQGILIGADSLAYFTGTVVDAPDTERGCRTKIAVQVDGDLRTLWHTWRAGLHRVSCYGDLADDLRRFCRFKSITLVDEARATMA